MTKRLSVDDVHAAINHFTERTGARQIQTQNQVRNRYVSMLRHLSQSQMADAIAWLECGANDHQPQSAASERQTHKNWMKQERAEMR